MCSPNQDSNLGVPAYGATAVPIGLPTLHSMLGPVSSGQWLLQTAQVQMNALPNGALGMICYGRSPFSDSTNCKSKYTTMITKPVVVVSSLKAANVHNVFPFSKSAL